MPADQAADGAEQQYFFDWKTLFLVFFAQGIPTFLGLTLVGITFKFALMAKINQGVITVMLGVTSILTAIVFYCKLGEVLSFIKVFGMFFMIGAGVFLSIDEKTEDDSDDTGLTEAEMK